jgi:hypothetical protein
MTRALRIRTSSAGLSPLSVSTLLIFAMIFIPVSIRPEKYVTGSYLWELLGQWDILLLSLTCIGYTNFLTTSAFVKRIKIKNETSKKIRETNGGQWDILLLNLTFHKYPLDVSSLIVTTSAFVNKRKAQR